ncbi:MAG: 50S ribosomal protein L11 methyltransferase [Clostridiales Family XIII bacterium]|jgi:ribosomal protein L11 methyltransferase|nr:50S ribosomal protein L11 methyltransferase [Clostridiales Family XIII bacterium]
MDYIETKIYTTTAGVEPVCAMLARHGVDEVSVEDSADLQAIIDAKDWLGWDYVSDELTGEQGAGFGGAQSTGQDGAPCAEPDGEQGVDIDPLSNEAVIAFYTEDTDAGGELLSQIKIALMSLKGDEQYGHYGEGADFGRLYAESEPLTDEWKNNWKESFRAFRASERIVIKPSWDEGEADALVRGGDIVIAIDPGMAFGTGTHETTAMCLAELERTLRPSMSVLDIGAGSGILSIAAAMLGAGRVTAVEYDADAAASAAGNLALNGVEGRVELIEGDIRELAEKLGRYDIVAANLASGLVKQITGLLREVTAGGGRLIVSGLLDREEQDMRGVLESAGFIVSRVETRGEWLLICVDFS